MTPPLAWSGSSADSDRKHHADQDTKQPPSGESNTAPPSPKFVCCDSKDPYMKPSSLSPEEINASLNLNLGLSMFDNPTRFRRLRSVMAFLNNLLVVWWEVLLFHVWSKWIPMSVRQSLVFGAWDCYLPLHNRLLQAKTGIHPDVSLEYHALTTVLWWGRLFPVTIRRIRFMLSQLGVWRRGEVDTSRVEQVEYVVLTSRTGNVPVPEIQQKYTTVRGAYIHHASSLSQQVPLSERRVIFWLYGGAFLAGCVDGNLGPAHDIGLQTEKDVFVPHYRLLPECSFDDMLWDVCLSYRWLVEVRGVSPDRIVLFGISSGAGLCTRLMQFLGELKRNEPTKPSYIAPLLSISGANLGMPSGAVLMCPFVDYTEPKGSLAVYPAHDLVVNQSVTELGFPYLEKTLGSHVNRTKTSPVHRSFQDLPPLCVVVSEHEVVYDQTVALVNRARKQNVSVCLGVWQYTCHVFCFLDNFIPEGQQSMEFVCRWISDHFKDKKD